MLARIRHLVFRATYWRGPLLMSALRKRWIVFRHPHAEIRFGRHVYLGPGFSLHMPERGTFVAGDGVEFRRDFRAEIAGDGRIAIGAGSVFTYSVLMQCTTSIDVGERCVFAQGVIVVDGQHRFRDLGQAMLEQGYDFTPIAVGDDAFVGAKAAVMAGVGERAVVGANAVVTRPVPAYAVAVGAPARVVDRFGP
ncbi:MAG TPA: acyltransferase [Solirubrobacteraceae bacterium]|nr:acyltransferase [Solirubrobacteraceae bacterium]